MELLLSELKDKLLQQMNEEDVLEVLNISVEDLLNAFEDRIEEKYEFLIGQISNDDDAT